MTIIITNPLPAYELGDKVIDPQEYQERGSIRLITKENNEHKTSVIIEKKDLH
jgi:hypothetical protein